MSGVEFRDGTHPVEYKLIRVTAVSRQHPKLYRGELVGRPSRKLFAPSELRIGQPIVFSVDHVFLIMRKPPTKVKGSSK
jgi:hypothetical protein